MKQKNTIALFVVLVLALVVVYFITTCVQANQKTSVGAQLIIPQTKTDTANQEHNRLSSLMEETKLTTLLQLDADEMLLSVVSSDIDNDTYEDQIIAIKRYNNPSIFIIVGLYNPLKMNYERTIEYQTPISQTRTFALSVLDLAANGENAITYTGFTDKNNSFFQALNLKKENGVPKLVELANLESAGSIFLQQNVENSREFRYGDSKAPYTIVVHSTETNEEDDSFNQVQTQYRWNEKTKRFEEFSVEKTPGTRIEAKELAKIQDGTVASFSAYLDGLWYFANPKTNEPHSIFFDWNNKEIIFSSGEIQEIFSWENSSVRRNGIYISTVNSLIPNLNRKIDISLVTLDEIRVRISADLGMVINTDTTWDGNYKKIPLNQASKTKKTNESANLIDLLENGAKWTFLTTSTLHISNGTYSFTSGANKEEGIYAVQKIQDETLLQFRSFSKDAFFNGFYSISGNKDSILLQPVHISVNGLISQNGSVVVLERILSD